jgi:hypothetical protein
MDQDLTERLNRLCTLEDVEEIKKLRARYFEACDGGWDGRATHNTEKILSFFTEDCVWDGGRLGIRNGRQELRAYYAESTPSDAPLAFHILTNPIVEVAGDRATGNWHLTIMLTNAEGKSMLVSSVLDDEYTRTPEGWRISRTRYAVALTGQYEGAWSQLSAGV